MSDPDFFCFMKEIRKNKDTIGTGFLERTIHKNIKSEHDFMKEYEEKKHKTEHDFLKEIRKQNYVCIYEFFETLQTLRGPSRRVARIFFRLVQTFCAPGSQLFIFDFLNQISKSQVKINGF